MTETGDRRRLVNRLGERFRRNGAAVVSRLRGKRTALPPDARNRSLRIGLVIAALTVLSILVAAIFLDGPSVLWVRSRSASVNHVFQAITGLGKSNWILIPTAILVLLLLFGDWQRVDRATRLAWSTIGALAFYLFAAVAGSGIAVNIIKPFVGRVRPLVFEAVDPFNFHPFRPGYDHASFPSAHATTMGALIVAGCLIFPRWRPAIIAAGFVIAASRVMVRAHYPSDVVGGLALGGLFAYGMARFLAGIGYGFSHRPHATIRARTEVVRRAFARRGGPRRMLAGLVKALEAR